MYSISYADAYNIWMKSQLVIDNRVVKIIRELIKMRISIILNRNPTISYGSILYMEVVDISFDYSMQIPLGVLPLFAADFDGDVLNVLLIINEEFRKQAELILDPRNSMFISKNDGLLESSMVHSKDSLININSLISIGRKKYSDNQVEEILKLKAL